MLSILIPTYNCDLTNLVDVLQKQASKTALEYEIIVMDDASPQKEMRVQNERLNSVENCTYVIQKENLGRTATRQNLALAAKYNNLLFLDADVLPKHSNFIEKFDVLSSNWELIFGGIAYKEEAPKPEEILRWKYGKDRESISLANRQSDPYLSVNSGAFLIKKEIFLVINSELNFKVYGLDNLFKQLLFEKGVKITHIDNPVYHLGLENATQFIRKSKESVKTTVDLEQQNLIDYNLRPIQKAYLKIKKYRLTGTFKFFMKLLDAPIQRNFQSSNPSLTLFDLYRLSYYIELKSKNDA